MPRSALILGTAAAVLVGLAPAAANAATTNLEFTTAGEHAFTVPAGVIQFQVALTGAHGGNSRAHPGGLGADVAGTLSVQPGQVLFAEVGGPGDNAGGASAAIAAGGVNGGGSGGAGGGGASDIRTVAAGGLGSLDSRLAVAGGGGGATFDTGFVPGTYGGAAGAAGGDPGGLGVGGQPGKDAGGAGGLAGISGRAGGVGRLGTGGDGAGPNFRGGGGGGGYYGGGGGGGMGACNPCDSLGGGGGGSSLVPAGWTRALADPAAAARARISYEPPAAR